MSDDAGHLFVVQGDLTKLSCDGILIPCDGDENVSWWWFEMFELEPPAGLSWARLPVDTRLRPTRQGAVAHQLVDTVTVNGDIDLLVRRVHEGLQALSKLVVPRGGGGRVLPLVALPMPGTGQGGLDGRRGAVVRALVPELARSARDLRIDIVLVDRDRRDFAAIQSARRSEDWSLSAELLSEADRLGELAACGELSVFVGAGVSVPLGLPGWESLVNGLLRRAGRRELRKGAGEPALLRAAAQAKSALGRDYDKVLGELLEANHHALAHGLVASLQVRESVTTNFDRALELAMSTTHGADLKVLTSQWAGQSAPWLVKLHGTAGQGKVVLTKQDYSRHRKYDGAPLYGLVQGLLMTSHLLFVGFSLTDSNYLKLAKPVADLHQGAGGRGKVATALGLKSLASEKRVLDRAFNHVSFGQETHGIGRAGRALEIFLDRIAWTAARSHRDAHGYVLDERYADLVEGQDLTALKSALLTLQGEVAGLTGPGAARVREQLAEFGADPQVSIRQSTGTSS